MKYNYITIEREYASGGREIGDELAKELNIPCYGKEILHISAKKIGVSPERLIDLEEKATGSFLYSMYLLGTLNTGETAGLTDNQQLHIFETNIIKELALKGPCIFVGHCAGWAIRERTDVLNAFIHAGGQSRQERAINRYHVDPGKVDEILKKTDKRRANYFKANTNEKWEDKENYHMILDSGKLGTDGCVNAIMASLIEK